MRKTSFSITMKTARITAITGVRWTTKSLKVKFALEAIMMLGGSPISVAVPPMFEASASATR